MKYSRDLQSVANTGSEFVPILLPFEAECVYQMRRLCPASQCASRNEPKVKTVLSNHIPRSERVLKLSADADYNTEAIDDNYGLVEWRTQLRRTSEAKRNLPKKPISVKTLFSNTNGSARSSSEFPVIVPPSTVQGSAKTQRLLHIPLCQGLNSDEHRVVSDEAKAKLRITRGVGALQTKRLHAKNKTCGNPGMFGIAKKRIKWYNKRPRVIINKYYEYNFTGNTEKEAKNTKHMNGVISRIAILFAHKKPNYASASKKIESNKVKI
eukprot:TRINITY_DN2588_c0_g3_i2.p1 TRINITY_DN2588_c0_g3~~TRINITY_DN2588_c0_g3_i2.p1  ORF type:complete len:267 (+),score=24.32 TRINITY_DN2588_c0_g3_i2:78-878(+)